MGVTKADPLFSFRSSTFLAILLLLLVSTLSAQNKSTEIRVIDGHKFYIHKAEKKQSLYAISKIYNVSVDEILQHNPDLKKGLKAGNEVRIPVVGAPPVAATATAQQKSDTTKYITHRVEKKETVFSITRKFNVSEKQLIAWNPSMADGLKEGQILIVGERKKAGPVISKEQKPAPHRELKHETVKIDSAIFVPEPKVKKNRYNVALMLPFRLDATLNIEMGDLVRSGTPFPAIPGLAVDYYLGFRKAIDSLSSPEFEVNLELYDMDDLDSLKPVQVISDPHFRETDMIFGPLYTNQFRTVSRKALELKIPLISPIASQNKILHNNIYVSKTNPSQHTLFENLADYCADSLATENSRLILVYFDKDKKGMQFVQAFRKYYNERQRRLGRPAKDTVNLARGIAGVKAASLYGGKNIVVTLSNNQVFITDFTTQLALYASDKNDITLCGWEAITQIDNIDQEYLNQLHFTFPTQYNLTNPVLSDQLSAYYRSQQETFPEEYYYMGFDVAMYYLKNLRDKGPDFIYSLDTLPSDGNYLRFRFARPDRTTGFDNRGTFIFRYQDYRLQRTGWN